MHAVLLSRAAPQAHRTLIRSFVAWHYRAAACDVQGVWLPLILMLQSCKFFKVILEAQVTQICSMDILRLTIDFYKNVQSLVLKYGVLWRMAKMVDFIKMFKVWSLCMEFYGAW